MTSSTSSISLPVHPVPVYHMVTGVREHDGRVWLGSLHEPSVAVHDLA